MQINRKFWRALSPALSELKQKINCDFVVFGSAPLYLWGVLPFEKAADLNDLDIAVGDDFVPPEEMQEVLFHDDPRQKLYKISIRGVNVDIGAAWPGREKIYEKIFNSAIEVDGFKFAGLDTVYILPSYQRMGVGCRLLEKAFAWLGEEKSISLEVVEYNAGAIAFYQRCGFEIAKKADSYIFPSGKQMPLLEMIKNFREEK
jgi:ribosomal protein S18 acetylase RimI-like enzyme